MNLKSNRGKKIFSILTNSQIHTYQENVRVSLKNEILSLIFCSVHTESRESHAVPDSTMMTIETPFVHHVDINHRMF